MDVREYFKNKKITVQGLGLLGRGVGDVAFLAQAGADLIVTDLKTEDELEDSLEKLQGFSNITYRLGEHVTDDFKGRDIILRAPNAPLDSEFLEVAQRNGAHITQSTALFAKLTSATLVGVTGSRGKSTVTQMIFEGLKVAGRQAHLGGNVRGMSTLALLPEVGGEDVMVLELDSWQMQSFGDEKISPHVAVFTTFLPDHMDYYKGDMERYLAEKANIFKYQTPEDVFVAGDQANRILEEEYSADMLGQKYVASETDIPPDWELLVPGRHNRYNAGCAKKALEALGVSEDVIRKSLTSFRGLPFRLEFVREVDLPAQAGGVKIYNDSNGTSPDATIAALNAFPDNDVVLIAGGTDKNLSTEKLAKEIKTKTKGLVLLSGSGTDHLKKHLEEGTYTEVGTLEECLEKARSLVTAGDVIIFSPGFSSHEKFRNEYDRGEQFTALVKKL